MAFHCDVECALTSSMARMRISTSCRCPDPREGKKAVGKGPSERASEARGRSHPQPRLVGSGRKSDQASGPGGDPLSTESATRPSPLPIAAVVRKKSINGREKVGAPSPSPRPIVSLSDRDAHRVKRERRTKNISLINHFSISHSCIPLVYPFNRSFY